MIIGPFYWILKTKPFHGCSKRCIMNIHKGTLGVEPRTCRTAAGCSTTELYPLHVIYLDQKNCFFFCSFFPKEALNNKDEIKEEKKKKSSHLGIEPRTFGLEIQRAILCANGTVLDLIKFQQSVVSIYGPLGYGPSTLPLRHSAILESHCNFWHLSMSGPLAQLVRASC